jgi:hypothetical protein
MASSPPTLSTITTSQLSHLLTLYPQTIKSHYAFKVSDPKKLTEALNRDKWRYDELPSLLKDQDGHGKGTHMSLNQLEDLVKWKTTHGHSRPFLMGMVRKNEDKAVKSATTYAAERCNEFSSSLNEKIEHGRKVDVEHVMDSTMKALESVSKLNGVGPATSSLVLSVYAPEHVPFFEDEMFMWLCRDAGTQKLKYDRKEYKELVRRVWELRERLSWKVSAVEIEKAAFVVEHWDLVDEKGRNGVPEAGDVSESAQEFKNSDSGQKPLAKAATKVDTTKKGTKRGTPNPEPITEEKEATGTRRSKRVKK